MSAGKIKLETIDPRVEKLQSEIRELKDCLRKIEFMEKLASDLNKTPKKKIPEPRMDITPELIEVFKKHGFELKDENE